MTRNEQLVNEHYGLIDISARILEGLLSAGKDIHNLTRDDLASFDEFHAGGRESTRELARLAALSPGTKVLDVGSGIGGPARTLAAEFGCSVRGVDLTDEYCRAARMLTEKLGMSEQVGFQCGNALRMPFEDASFDIVWSQNTLMNVEDKLQLFREVARVLRPGGCFAFETILAGSVPDIHYPVFWADAPALNFLITPHEAKGLLTGIGFREQSWQDTTQRSLALQSKRKEVVEREGVPRLGLNVIVPVKFLSKMENVLRNNLESRTITVQAVYVI